MNSRPRYAILIALACTLALAPAASFAQGVLFVTGGDVGINIDTPTQKLHVTSDDGSAQVLVDETTAASAIRTMFAVRNFGRPRFDFQDVEVGSEWQFAMKGAGFTIRKTGSGETEIQVDASGRIRFGVGDVLGTRLDSTETGNLVILGTLTEGSSRTIKKDFSSVDGTEILERVAELPISMWTYTADRQGARHLGPMAEDFSEAFGLGEDDKHLAPKDAAGVALAAIQGLYGVVQEKDDEIGSLRAENAQLAERLESLELAVQELAGVN